MSEHRDPFGVDHGLHPGEHPVHPDVDAAVICGGLHPLGSGLGGATAVHGAPDAAVNYWFPQSGETCLPASVTQAVAEITGHEPSLHDALDKMQQLQLPIDVNQGTPNGLTEGQQLLAQGYGIPCHLEQQNDQGVALHNLESYLDQHRSVILGVNADPIWNHGHDDPQNPQGHAVLITAIDENATAADGSRGVVTLSDTGNPTQSPTGQWNGNEEQVPLDVFTKAWADSGNQMLVTDVPVPAHDTTAEHPGPVLLPMTLNPDALNAPVAPLAPITTSATDTGSHTVQPGDTLWDIAEQHYGDGSQYPRIAEANAITTTDPILPGQTLTIPQ